MASVSFDQKKNRFRIRFVASNGSRPCLSLSIRKNEKRNGAEKRAHSLLSHVEQLIECRASGRTLEKPLQKWIDGLKPGHRKTLEQAGLLSEADSVAPTMMLSEYLTDWFSHRSDAKDSTVVTWKNAERNLTDYFGSEKPLADITPEDGENFERWLSGDQKLSRATTRKRIQIAKQMLQSAKKARLIPENPFADMKTGSIRNKTRQHFVSVADTIRLLDACSSTEWRVAVALARFGALRMPSEIRELKWEDINWEHRSFLVFCPKLEHHEDKSQRVVPLFPEIERELLDLREIQGDESIYVLPSIRHTTNTHPTLLRIVKRAGLKPWPRLWQNLRASRATELEAAFGGAKAATVCGHAEKVAQDHYWMTTGEDITQMASLQSVPRVSQQASESGGNGSQAYSPAQEKTPVFPGSASNCDELQLVLMGDEGLEPPTSSL
ncbi:MAG: phage integrase SAM-like domain-containing protein [Planctomycetaceae bacterium]|nr:phage integrase SAM-like domain-containing protein [Planctomycetaceae bacterium]